MRFQLYSNPISTERGQIWPGWPNPVWHFHILMVRVTKLHDFVSFYICQVPERSFFEKRKSIFEKSKKMIWQFQHQRVPPLDRNKKRSKFFSFLKKNHTFVPEHDNLKCSQLSFDVDILSFAINFKFCNILLEKHHFWHFSFRGL